MSMPIDGLLNESFLVIIFTVGASKAARKKRIIVSIGIQQPFWLQEIKNKEAILE